MKAREKLVSAAAGAALACLAAAGSLGAFLTGFDLPLDGFPRMAAIWALIALCSAAAFSFSGGGWLVSGALALEAGYLWRQGQLQEQLLRLLEIVSRVYDNVYHWGFLDFGVPQTGSVDLPVMVTGALLVLAGTWTVCRGETSAFILGYSLMPLLPCFVITDTVPAWQSLYTLFLADILFLLTGRVRRENVRQGNLLTALAALPVALALGGLFLAMPESTYVNQAEPLRQHILSWFQSVPRDTPQMDFSQLMDSAEKKESVDLTALKSWHPSTAPKMDVFADLGGTLYLRGQDYDIYDGLGWTASPKRVETFRFDGVDLGKVTLETRETCEILYLPYYPQGGLSLIGGKIDNSRLAKVCTYPRMGLPGDWQARSAPPARGQEAYLSLPPETRQQCLELLKNRNLQGTTGEIARTVGDFVRESAVYDRDTGPMPQEEGDFALWFLRESDRGYCVHFATAAVVLLRAAGVPARYVTGYMVTASAQEQVTVTGENAHAWAEYYDPGLDAWLILEATPASGLPDPIQEPEPQPETAPSDTEAVTEPSAAATTGPEATTMETTVPGTAPPPADAAPKTGLLSALKGVIFLALALGALEGQRRLRIFLGRGPRGGNNAQALACWRETELLCKIQRKRPPKDLEALANKAKFSQHTLTPEELEAFSRFLREEKQALEEKPWYLRLIYRYVFAVP